MGLGGARGGGGKNFSVGVCDGAQSTAHSSYTLQKVNNNGDDQTAHMNTLICTFMGESSKFPKS